MYGDRRIAAYREGVHSFRDAAEANKQGGGFMFCPCVECQNEKDHTSSRVIHSHLLRFGFMSGYNVWTKHGEKGVMMDDGDEEDNDDNYRSMFTEYGDTAMEDNEEEGQGEERAPDEPADDLGRVISDARRGCDTEKERLQFEQMLQDHNKLLYRTCEDGQKKLGSTLELLKWKAESSVADSAFEKLLLIMKKMLPRKNELPANTRTKQRSLSAL